MTPPVRNLVFGGGTATLLALVMLVPSLGGVSTWKWALAAVGLVLFVFAGRGRAAR